MAITKGPQYNFTEIDWQNKPFLYSQTSQGQLEKSIFQSMLKGQPQYWQSDVRFVHTIACPIFHDMFVGIEDLIKNLDDIPEPFTKYPLFMCINASPYEHDLYRGISGEIIIDGPIEIKHIEVIHALNLNRLEEFNTGSDDIFGNCMHSLEYSMKRYKLAVKNLSQLYNQDHDKIINRLTILMSRRQLSMMQVTHTSIQPYIDVLDKITSSADKS